MLCFQKEGALTADSDTENNNTDTGVYGDGNTANAGVAHTLTEIQTTEVSDSANLQSCSNDVYQPIPVRIVVSAPGQGDLIEELNLKLQVKRGVDVGERVEKLESAQTEPTLANVGPVKVLPDMKAADKLHSLGRHYDEVPLEISPLPATEIVHEGELYDDVAAERELCVKDFSS